jgi:DNA-binding transcriptional LysR family regulator
MGYASRDELVAVAAPSHRWCQGKKRRVLLGELAGEPFLCRERGSGSREVIEAALQERGLSIEPAMALGSTEAIKSAVAAGLGVAILSRLTVELELSTLTDTPVGSDPSVFAHFSTGLRLHFDVRGR